MSSGAEEQATRVLSRPATEWRKLRQSLYTRIWS